MKIPLLLLLLALPAVVALPARAQATWASKQNANGYTLTNSGGIVHKDAAAASVTLTDLNRATSQLDWARVAKTGGSLADLSTRNFSDLQNKPTTLSGYGISDALTASSILAAGNVTGTLSAQVLTNSGLLGAAFKDVGTASGTVAAGDDARITGAVQTTGSYADPDWLTSVSWAKITSVPSWIGATTTFSQSLLTATNSMAARATLGLGTVAVLDAGSNSGQIVVQGGFFSASTLSAPLSPIPYGANVVFDGESTTAATGNNWPAAFQNTAIAQGRNLTFQNLAVGGSHLSAVQSRWTSTASSLMPNVTGKPAFYFLWIGINDLSDASYNFATYSASLSGYWDAVRATGAKLVVFTIHENAITSGGSNGNNTGTSYKESQRQQLNKFIRDSSSHYDYLVEVEQLIRGMKSPLLSDGTHPTTTAAPALAQLAANSILTPGNSQLPPGYLSPIQYLPLTHSFSFPSTGGWCRVAYINSYAHFPTRIVMTAFTESTDRWSNFEAIIQPTGFTATNSVTFLQSKTVVGQQAISKIAITRDSNNGCYIDAFATATNSNTNYAILLEGDYGGSGGSPYSMTSVLSPISIATQSGTVYNVPASGAYFPEGATVSGVLGANTLSAPLSPILYGSNLFFDGDATSTYSYSLVSLPVASGRGTTSYRYYGGSRLIADLQTTYTNTISAFAPNTTGVPGYIFAKTGMLDIANFTNTTSVSAFVTALTNYWDTARAAGFKVVAFTIEQSGFYPTNGFGDAYRRSINSSIRSLSTHYDYLVDMDIVLPTPTFATPQNDALTSLAVSNSLLSSDTPKNAVLKTERFYPLAHNNGGRTSGWWRVAHVSGYSSFPAVLSMTGFDESITAWSNFTAIISPSGYASTNSATILKANTLVGTQLFSQIALSSDGNSGCWIDVNITKSQGNIGIKISGSGGDNTSPASGVEIMPPISIATQSGTIYDIPVNGMSTDGDVILSKAGNGFRIKEGSNARMGVETFSSGVATISNTTFTPSTRLKIDPIGTEPMGFSYTVTTGSATVYSTVATASNPLSWLAIEPAP